MLLYRFVSSKLKPGPWRKREMKEDAGGLYIAYFDTSDEAAEDLMNMNGIMEYQIVLADGKTRSRIEKIEMSYCPKTNELKQQKEKEVKPAVKQER